MGSRSLSLTHTCGVGPPDHRNSLPLAGSAVGDEGLAEAVFMNRTLTHVCHTRPAEDRMVGLVSNEVFKTADEP